MKKVEGFSKSMSHITLKTLNPILWASKYNAVYTLKG